jgi:gas vesicle protein
LVNRDQDFGRNYGVGFLMGVLAGTAIGAGLALLLTPKSGIELRANVREAAQRRVQTFRKGKPARTGEPEFEEHA